ncbi:hypothetical protein [Acidovorax sp. PRC11]|uniref:hypothetical protein n=1 Tax=Acidovorax sp. PRC11 TaxID=2962592 RepID=UPI0028829318|nr:hypothetical protein [Acidovorax sp. PRC11]MDT0140820.1 hypothetical protein [Acidovorax sp. PRC11]
MKLQAHQYGYLWDGTAPQWALMNVAEPNSEPQYLIVNTDAKAAKLIENKLVADEVVERMLAAGVRVLAPAEF